MSYLNESMLSSTPYEIFNEWLHEASINALDEDLPMVLSTVDIDGHPDSRVVLFKGFKDNCILFYTNYESSKGKQIEANPYVSLNIYWPKLFRQIRIKGKCNRVSNIQSDLYFASRPLLSQLSASISPQSQVIANKDVLIELFESNLQTIEETGLKRPMFWGGYAVTIYEIEFWQAGEHRLHDRIRYCLKNTQWSYQRLAP